MVFDLIDVPPRKLEAEFAQARAALRKIEAVLGRPSGDDDRRLCIGAAVLAQTTFNENWLCDSLAAVEATRPANRFNYFRTCLATKGADLPRGATRDEQRESVSALNRLLWNVEIPPDLADWPREASRTKRKEPDAIDATLETIGRLPES